MDHKLDDIPHIKVGRLVTANMTRHYNKRISDPGEDDKIREVLG